MQIQTDKCKIPSGRDGWRGASGQGTGHASHDLSSVQFTNFATRLTAANLNSMSGDVHGECWFLRTQRGGTTLAQSHPNSSYHLRYVRAGV